MRSIMPASASRSRLTFDDACPAGVSAGRASEQDWRVLLSGQKVNEAPTCTIRGRTIEVVALLPAVNGSR